MRTDAFIPENANEETLMLQGRINALAAVLAYTKGEAISKELVKANTSLLWRRNVGSAFL